MYVCKHIRMKKCERPTLNIEYEGKTYLMMDCSLFRQLRRNESFCWSFKSIFELVVSIEKLNKYILQNEQFSLHYIEFETSSSEV